MPDRIVVFLDYMNIYWSARSSFHLASPAPRRFGGIDPAKLGAILTDMGPKARTLAEVRVYRGMPSPTLDPRSHRAWQRQVASWRASGVKVVTQAIWYPVDWPNVDVEQRPKEKGIDVALAVDLVDLAHRREYDIAIVFSLDADLIPALERVQTIGLGTGRPRIEVTAWSPGTTDTHRLRTSRNTWCHWLDEAVYRQVQDLTDYSR
ncbi:MAG: NYN domain-containing protein [Demequinaceae bacterium]|nr:NYN domain-containing protein [Demequinaceae bacterium]